jgi:hypothetical protein
VGFHIQKNKFVSVCAKPVEVVLIEMFVQLLQYRESVLAKGRVKRFIQVHFLNGPRSVSYSYEDSILSPFRQERTFSVSGALLELRLSHRDTSEADRPRLCVGTFCVSPSLRSRSRTIILSLVRGFVNLLLCKGK